MIEETYNSDYGTLYLIETTYNAERDATEVIFGYMEKETDIEGRYTKIRVIVNVSGGAKGDEEVIAQGLKKAKKVLKKSSKAAYKKD